MATAEQPGDAFPPTANYSRTSLDAGAAGTGAVLLARYQVRRVLGRGAMGEVLEVHDQHSGVEYALKRVPPELARDAAQMSGIRANFALVSQLTHPHIATTRQLEIDPQTHHALIVMDLVRGQDLAQWLAEERQRRGGPDAALPLELALGIAEQIAAALDYAHAQPVSYHADRTPKTHGILHRDLKPGNVMVEAGREYRPGVPFVKLADFGLAAEIQASLQSMSVSGQNKLCGTPCYMAPEQWEGRTLTRGVDQWALAVMLYEMLAGRRPFNGQTETAVMHQVAKASPEPPEQLTPVQWAALKRAFQPDRKARYPSCLTLVKSLASAGAATKYQVLAGEVPMPDEPRSSQPLPLTAIAATRPARRRSFAWPALLAAAVIGGGACLYAVYGGKPEFSGPAAETPASHRAVSEEEHKRREEHRQQAQAQKLEEERKRQEEQARKLADESKQREERQQQEQSRNLENERKGKERGLRQAFSSAFALAVEAKRRNEWDQVVASLDKPLHALGALEHPNREAAESLLKQARAELQQRAGAAAKAEEAERAFLAGKPDEALAAYQAALQLWPETPQHDKIAAEIRKCTEVLLASAEKAYAQKDFALAGKWYRQCAESGHADAQMKLGNMCLDGQGAPKNDSEALKWHRKAAEQDRVEAQIQLGQMYEKGIGTEADGSQAVRWYQKAAAQGSGLAQYLLGQLYWQGNSVIMDKTRAFKYFLQAAAMGHAAAEAQVGDCYRQGKGVLADASEAVAWYRKAAEHGVAEVQWRLGNIYSTGDGVERNYEEAVKWYRAAAQQGDALSQVRIASLYELGLGVPKDLGEAVKWLQLSAEQGCSLAQCQLAQFYDEGRGVPADLAAAFQWHLKAAEQGNGVSQWHLGLAFADGRGVKRDDAQALVWYRKSAAQKYARAQFYLGYMYSEGRGVAKDLQESARWFKLAAEGGDSIAQNFLGYYCENGIGVPKNETAAFNWYGKAAAQGLAQAQFNLGVLYSKGAGTARDEAQAFRWYLAAAQNGNVIAQRMMGWCCTNGWNTAQDPDKAVEWYRKAARQGDAESQNELKKRGKKW